MLLGIEMKPDILLNTLAILALGSLVFAVIGVGFAWLSPSPSAFHALMSVVLIPMWLLSGAMFPLDGKVFSMLAVVNPMAYLVAGLRKSLLDLPGSFVVCFSGLSISLIIGLLLLFVAVSRHPIE